MMFIKKLKITKKNDDTDLTNLEIEDFIKNFKSIVIVNTWRNSFSSANAKNR